MQITAPIDLDAYLARIGLGLAPAPDAKGLEIVQRAHRLSIPFENLDVRLGRGISLDPGHVFEKLVVKRRGGYCFEQNQLFLRALTDRHYSRRNGEQHVEADIESATAYRLRLNFVFGIALDDVEVGGLGLF